MASSPTPRQGGGDAKAGFCLVQKTLPVDIGMQDIGGTALHAFQLPRPNTRVTQLCLACYPGSYPEFYRLPKKNHYILGKILITKKPANSAGSQ